MKKFRLDEYYYTSLLFVTCRSVVTLSYIPSFFLDFFITAWLHSSEIFVFASLLDRNYVFEGKIWHFRKQRWQNFADAKYIVFLTHRCCAVPWSVHLTHSKQQKTLKWVNINTQTLTHTYTYTIAIYCTVNQFNIISFLKFQNRSYPPREKLETLLSLYLRNLSKYIKSILFKKE